MFLILGEAIIDRNLINCSPIEFQAIRIEAERQAKRENIFFSLADIYSHFDCLYPSAKNTLDSILEQELLLEKKICTFNPDILDKINIERNRGNQIAHVSDMYLPKSFIEELLIDNGIMGEGDFLYVSNHDKAAKGDGTMFRKICKEHNIPFNRISHIGNCYHADYLGAKSVGIDAVHYKSGNLSNREIDLEKLKNCTNGRSSYWAGVSRIGRLSQISEKTLSKEYLTLEQIACSVAAPILCSYVKWVLDQALKDKVKNLFFVARDGQLLWEISKILKENNSNYKHLNLKYLHGSREAWRPSTIIEIDDFALNWLMDDHPTLTPQKISQRLKIEINKLRKAPKCPSKFYQENEVIPLEHHNEIKKWLTTPAVSKLIENSVIGQRELLLKYFEQEGVFEEFSAFVEIGCSGKTQHAIYRMLRSCGKASPSNYFFGLADKNLHSDGFQAKAYFYNQVLNQGFPASPDLNYFVLLESFCMADHGRTLAYEIKNEKVAPTLAPKAKYFANERWEDFFRKKVLSTAVAYSKSELQNTETAADKLGFLEIIRNFWQKPSINVAKVWGSHLKEHDPTSGVVENLAHKFTFSDLSRNLLSIPINPVWWDAARDQLTSKTMKFLMQKSKQIGNYTIPLRIMLGKWKKYILFKNSV